MSQLIVLRDGTASIQTDDWMFVPLPPSNVEARKQAGKVVLFKLTGEETITPEQIAKTQIPDTGKVIVPLTVFIARHDILASRIVKGEVGVWLSTHELLETLISAVPDLNILPLISVNVERFADGRIFSLGVYLRTRYGFKNDMRATGDVLRDQLFFLKRSGFSSFVIRADRSAEEALASLNDFTKPYQGAVDIPTPAFARYHRQ
jgi:uncharacterized protein (DUF934 family)